MAAPVVAAGLVELRFFNLGVPGHVSVRARGFLFAADEVRTLPAGKPFAQYAQDHWRVGNARYTRLEIPHLVHCRLEARNGASEGHGPFARLEALGALLLADAKPFALLKSRQWLCLQSQRAWPRVRVEPAAEST